MTATTVAILLFWGYGAIGICDILYYHLHRFRLFERPECFKEHLLHTGQVLTTPFVVGGLYVGRTGGPWLWSATAVAAAQVMFLLWDVLEENQSRAQLGGLPRPEYFMHIVVCMLHAASLALVLSDRPKTAWFVGAPMLLEPISLDAWRWSILGLGAAAIGLGVPHLVLAFRGYRTIQGARQQQSVSSATV